MKYMIKKRDFVPYIFYALVILSVLLKNTYFTSYGDEERNLLDIALSISRYIAIMLGLYQIVLCSAFNIKEWLVIGTIGIVVLSTTYFSGDKNVILFYVTIVSILDREKNTYIRELMIITSIILITTVILSLVGVFPNLYRDIGFRNRYMLGFKWPTYGPAFLFFAVVDYFMILAKQKMPKILLVLVLTINYWFYYQTNTKSVFYELLLLIILVFFFDRAISKSKLLKSKVVIIVPWIAALISYFSAYLYDPFSPFMIALNRVFTNRLSYGNRALSLYGVSLFGQDVDWSALARTGSFATDNLAVDSSFLELMIRKGIVFTFLILVLLSIVMYQQVQKQNQRNVLIICFIIMFCMTEPWLINVAINPLFLLIDLHIKHKDGFVSDKRFRSKRQFGFGNIETIR